MADQNVQSEVQPLAFTLMSPAIQTSPVVFASPHSGRYYPDDFVAASRLDQVTLRRSEDALVDRLFAGVPDHGAPLLAARYARAYCDLNREPYELDPAMFSTPLPVNANIRSSRVASGLGTIARTVGAGVEIYRSKLRVSEIERRLSLCYHPYHHQLAQLVESTHQRFGVSLVVDCHSMPSLGIPMGPTGPVDMVLGDCHGLACDPAITDVIEACLTARGYHVERNYPYAGGFTTSHYGHPTLHSHSIQIEINRALYLDGSGLEPGPDFQRLAADLDHLVRCLTAFMIDWQSTCG